MNISMSMYILNFNSIKVQLKLPGTAGDGLGVLFQFHKGTIKTDKDYAFASANVISIP